MSRGLGTKQREIMATLGETESSLFPFEIRERIGSSDRPSIRKSIRSLEGRGLVELEDDGRVHLTFRGKLWLSLQNLPDEPDPVDEMRRDRREFEATLAALRGEREEEHRRYLEEEARWKRPAPVYERRRWPEGANQLRVIAVLVRYAQDPHWGLPRVSVRRIAGGEKANILRAMRTLIRRGTLQESKDGERLRLRPSLDSFLWDIAPDLIDPPLNDKRAKVVLQELGELPGGVA